MGSLSDIMVSKLEYQTFTSEFEFHWVSHSYNFVPHLNKKLCKLLNASIPLTDSLFLWFSREATWHLHKVGVILLVIKGYSTLGNTCLAELTLSLGTWGTPKWGMSRGSSIFLDGHTCVSFHAWTFTIKWFCVKLTLWKSDKYLINNIDCLRQI